MRIADVFSDDSDDDDDDAGEKFDENKRKMGDFDTSSLSRSLISRWFSKNYLFRIIKRKKKKKAGSGKDLDADQPAMPGEVAVVDPASDSEARRSEELDSGRRNEDFSVNFGMGVGLVFLLAKSATEFYKMTELRAEMEMLLKETKREVRRKDAIASSSESNNNISFSPSHCCWDIDTSKITSMPNCGACFSLLEAKCEADSDSGSKYATAFANARSLSIGQMEAELEVELERLRHNLEGQGSSVLQERMEIDCENNDPSFESFSLNCEEEEDVPKDANYHGVSARELERKLHELLEMRQQEKITELESALECAKQKLLEKEMELQWWKGDSVGYFVKPGQSIHHLAGKDERIILGEEN